MIRYLLIAVIGACAYGQTSALAINTANAREVVVSGVAAVGSGPVTIINVHFPAEVRIGTGIVLRDGTFAVQVKTALVQGQALVAVDRAGRRSARFAVAAPRTGPVPPPPPGH